MSYMLDRYIMLSFPACMEGWIIPIWSSLPLMSKFESWICRMRKLLFEFLYDLNIGEILVLLQFNS